MPNLFFIWTHSIWLQMPWEWFATAKVTSQVSLCASGWFLLWLKSQNQVRNACNKYRSVYCHLRASVYIAAILGQFPSNHFETVFFPPIPVQMLVRDLCAVCVLSGNEVIGVDSAEVRVSVQYLHIIDNQQTLFELSHKLEPRAWTHNGACHRGLRGKRHTFATRSAYQQRRPLDCKVPSVLKIPHGNI